MRRVAVSEGIVPKAPNAFALFMKMKNKVKKGASKEEFQHEMQRIGRAWRALSQSEKNKYKEESRSEFVLQREAMKRHGVPTRRPQRERGPSELSQPSKQLVEEPDKVPLRFGKIKVVEDDKIPDCAQRPDAAWPHLRPEDLQGQESFDLIEARGFDFQANQRQASRRNAATLSFLAGS